ncbi:glycerophosphodiester phosphodiesterase [Halopseudomonas salegens]|uniref:Glycerophosphoryl diester phosphodiesterase n=1 Tax=Halopseudomonas salegens TaxID=1434072 RepID=A0A1H2H323_9GAMM|nr:glycerophosphodiester phosphodiesterase [Halopseudomonas salegens]SDU26260.1 glycerophosphoryl diester phosphodiesterase [Halopseudomonas salegens]
MADLSGHLNTLANYLWSLSPAARRPVPVVSNLVAHRGAHGRGPAGVVVENTLEAFELCLQLGVWGAELDIQLTRDGEPVVHHDPHCGRLFQRPDLVIAETRYRDLRAAVPEIPHLDEVVHLARGRLHLMIEIKESWQQRAELPQRVSERLQALTPTTDFHLLSLEPEHLEGFREIPKAAYVDVAQANTAHIVRQNLALGHGAVAGSFALIGASTLQQLRDAGRRVGTGFVENRLILNREINRGVDWVFSDSILQLPLAADEGDADHS